jgi:hypothetical protein
MRPPSHTSLTEEPRSLDERLEKDASFVNVGPDGPQISAKAGAYPVVCSPSKLPQ